MQYNSFIRWISHYKLNTGPTEQSSKIWQSIFFKCYKNYVRWYSWAKHLGGKTFTSDLLEMVCLPTDQLTWAVSYMPPSLGVINWTGLNVYLQLNNVHREKDLCRRHHKISNYTKLVFVNTMHLYITITLSNVT